MTPRTLAAIGIRLLALYTVLLGTSSLLNYMHDFVQQRSKTTVASSMAAHLRTTEWVVLMGLFLVLCSVGFFLWLFADGLAHSMVARSSPREQRFETTITTRDLLSVMLVAVGVYLIALGVADLLQALSYYMLPLLFPRTPRILLTQDLMFIVPEAVGGGALLCFGLVLIVGARRIAACIPAARQTSHSSIRIAKETK